MLRKKNGEISQRIYEAATKVDNENERVRDERAEVCAAFVIFVVVVSFVVTAKFFACLSVLKL